MPRKKPTKLTLNITAHGTGLALAKVLRKLADELEEAGCEADGVERVLVDGSNKPLGTATLTEDD